MADKKITALNLLTYATAAAGDLLVIEDIDGAETKAITAENLAKYALGNRTIGGTTAGDIVTIDGTQTQTNKTFTSPKINEDVAVTATASELNKLDAVTAVTADFNAIAGIAAGGITPTEIIYLNGVSSAIQTQLNNLAAAVATTAKTYTYTVEWNDNAAATKTITAATIIAACGVPSGYGVNHATINPTLYERDGDGYELMFWGATYGITFDRTNIGGGVPGLDDLTISGLTNDSTTDYCFTMTFRAVAAGA